MIFSVDRLLIRAYAYNGYFLVSGMILMLNGHCIETELKRQQQRLIQRFLNGEVTEHLKTEYELITDFLKKVDLSKLRSEFPELDGSKEIKINLSSGAKGEFIINFPEGKPEKVIILSPDNSLFFKIITGGRDE